MHVGQLHATMSTIELTPGVVTDGFCAAFGQVPHTYNIELRPAHASTRRYARVTHHDSALPDLPSSSIWMLLSNKLSDEGGDRSTPAQHDELPFLNVQRFFEACDIRTPKIYGQLPGKLLILEDLGNRMLENVLLDALPAQTINDAERTALWLPHYIQAITYLVDIKKKAAAARSAGDEKCIAYTRSFDKQLLRWELDHFAEWGIPNPAQWVGRFDAIFEDVTNAILEQPQTLCHRDFQCRNLMHVTKPSGNTQWVAIDFQDALLGPEVYDLVALLCDSYVDLPEVLQLSALEHYVTIANACVNAVALDALKKAFWQVTVQRKLKDAGRFVFIDRVRGNPDFLQWYPQSMKYVARALSHLPEWASLNTLLAESVPGYPDAVHIPRKHG